MAPSFSRRWFRRQPTPAGQELRRRASRPAVELLEDRLVPATSVFDGGALGTGTTLDLAANWNPDGIPTTTAEAVLDNSIITLPAALTASAATATFGDLILNSTTLTSLSQTGTTSMTLTLSGGGGSAAATAAGGATGDLLLLGTNVTSGTVTVGGGSGTGKLNLALGSDGNFDVVNAGATAVVSGILTGAFNLSKTGPGTLTLSGVNTFGAGKTFTLSAGALNVNSTTALGSATTTFQINDGVTINNTSGAAITTVNANPINVNGDFTFSGGGTGTANDLTFKAATTTLNGAAGVRTITVTAANSSLGILGNIVSGTATGLKKTGAGVLLLSGANTFSGGSTLDQGTIVLGAATVGTTSITSSPVGTGTFTIGNAANFANLQTNVATTRTLNNAITLSGDVTFSTSAATGRIALNVNGSLTTPNAITLTRTNQLTAANTMVVDLVGAIGDGNNAFGLTLGGGATWNIGSTGTPEATANTYTGLTTLSAGGLTLNKTTTTDAIAGNLTINGGTLTSNVNENIKNTATVTVNTGGIWATNAKTETIGNLTIGGGTVSGGGTVIVTGAGSAAVNSGTLSATNFTTGTGGLTLGDGATVSSATTLNGDVTYNGTTTGATFGSGSISLNSNRTFTVADGAAAIDLTVSGALSDGSGNRGITKNGAGALTLSGVNTFSGGLTIASGTVVAGVSNATTVSGAAGPSTVAITLGSATGGAASLLANSFTVSNAINLAANAVGPLTLGNNGAATAAIFSGAIALNGNPLSIAPTGTGSITISNGITGTGDLTIANGGTTATTTISTGAVNNQGTITNSGGGSGTTLISAAINASVQGVVQNSLNSQLTLSGTNLFTAATKISAGTLSVGADANLGSSNALIFDGGTLQITGAALTTYASGSIGTHAVTQPTNKPIGFDINASGNTFTVSTALTQGSGGLLKAGAGALVLTNANTFSGPVSILGGTLQIGSGGASGVLPDVTTTITAGTLNFNRSDDIAFAGAIGGAGALVKNGAGVLTLNASGSYSGGTTIAANGGTISLGANSAIGSGLINLNSGTTLNLNTFNVNSTAAGDNFVSGGTLSGSGTFTFAGNLRVGFLNNVAATTIGAKLSGTGKVFHTAGTSTIANFTNPNNDYTGGTDVGGTNIGVTNFVNGGLGQTGAITIVGSVGALQWATGNNQDISGRLAIANGVTAQLDTNGNDVTFANSLGTTTGGFAKIGAGKLTIGTNSSAMTGVITFSNGGLVLRNTNTPTAGVLTVNNNGLEANGWLEIAAGASYKVASVAIPGVNNAYNTGVHLTGGTLTTTSGYTITNGFDSGLVGATAQSFMSGGTLNVGTTLRLGNGTDTGAAPTGGSGGTFNTRFTMSGGAVTVGSTVHLGHFSTAGNGASQLIMSGGTITTTGGIVLKSGNAGADQMNLILGGGTVTDNDPTIGVQLGAYNSTGNGRVFLAGTSVLEAYKIAKFGITTTNGNYNTVFFNGGTLRALGNNSTNFMGSLGLPTNTNDALGNSTSNVAFVYSGGATIDTNGFNVTVNPALVPRATATANGVGSITGIAAGNRGANYAIAPNVVFSGNGSGAAGYATLNATGGIDSIVITDPGSGYTTASISLSGGTLLAVGGVAATPANWTVNLRSSTVGGLTKIGSGTLTLAGINTYTGATAITAGTIALGANGMIATSNSVSISGGATYDVSAVAGGYAISQPLLAKGTGTAHVTGAVSAGTQNVDLKDGVNLGTLAFSSDVTFGGNSLSFDLGAAASDQITIGGTATFGGVATINLAALTSAASLATGTHAYTLVSAQAFSNVSYQLGATSMNATVNGVVYTFSLSNDTSNIYLDVASSGNNSVISASPSSFSFGRVMAPASGVGQSLTVSRITGTDNTGATVSVTGGALGATVNSTASGAGFITGTQNYVVSVGLTSGLGTHSDTVVVQNTGDSGGGASSGGAGQGSAQAPISIGVSGTVLQNRVVTADPIDFGLVHVGAAVSGSTTLRTTGTSDQNTSITVPNSGGTGFVVTGGSTSLVFDSPSVTDTRSLAGTLSTPGAISATAVSLTPTPEANVSGTQTTVPVALTYTANVFSGTAKWTANGPASYGAGVNWSDTVTPSIQAVPGSFAQFANTDVATFDGSSGGFVVRLDNAAPSLAGISLGAGAGGAGYLFQQGAGGSFTLQGNSTAAAISVNSGAHTFNVPIVLASNATVNVSNAAASVTFGAPISGTGGLMLGGSGAINITSANTYEGDTVIAGGRVSVNNPAVVQGSAFGSGHISVLQGATIGGTGSFSGALTIEDGGTLAPGNSPGTINTGDIALKSGSIMSEEIDSAGSYDIVNVTGSVNLNSNAIPNGGAKLFITLNYSPVNGTTYTIVSNDDVDPISGRFKDYNTNVVLNEGDVFAAGSHRFSITYQGGTNNNDVVLTVVDPQVNTVTPFIGPTSGGVTVVIAGLNFTGASAVKFGVTNATSYTVISGSQITAVAPAGAPATVDVVVTNTNVTSSAAGAGNDYTFAAPSVTSVVVNGGAIVARDKYNQTPVLLGQQSVVEQILVTFNQQVTLDPNAFTITSLSGSVTASVAIPSTASVAVTATGVPGTGTGPTGYTQYVLTFDAGAGVNSLDNTIGGSGNTFTTIKDGFFQLNTIGANVHAGLSDTAANRADPFWALYAAVNAADVTTSTSLGDGSSKLLADGVALGEMYATFGSFANAAGPPSYNTPYDSNLDGVVDGIDLSKMYANFGTIWQF